MIEVNSAKGPLVLGFPHTGTELPDGTGDGLNDDGRALADTDWHIHKLYADLLGGVSTVRTSVHRYVIDVNRDPDGASLYPGQNTTSLCPITDFDGRPIYQPRKEPDFQEVARRTAAYHAAYHAALQAELDRVHAIHGFAILYDCHSIRSQIPFLFDDILPDFNIGTNLGATCDSSIEALVLSACEAAADNSTVLNGRFKGGWTTRYYGRPSKGMHAIQMELAQSTYLSAEFPPWTFDAHKASRVRERLGHILTQLSDWSPQ